MEEEEDIMHFRGCWRFCGLCSCFNVNTNCIVTKTSTSHKMATNAVFASFPWQRTWRQQKTVANCIACVVTLPAEVVHYSSKTNFSVSPVVWWVVMGSARISPLSVTIAYRIITPCVGHTKPYLPHSGLHIWVSSVLTCRTLKSILWDYSHTRFILWQRCMASL